MSTLALDTTTRDGSAALVRDGRIVLERRGDGSRSHGERLPGELLAVVVDAGEPLEDVDLFAVAVGPGSFTGLRIGIATMQGLAFVTGRPIVPISALDVLAHAVSAALDLPAGTYVGAWMDAQRGDVFSALYRTAHAARFSPDAVIAIDAPSVETPGEVAARWNALTGKRPLVVTGDGAVRYGEAWNSRDADPPRILAPPVLAGAIGLMGEVAAARGAAVPPGAVRPLYVRRPDAVIARER